MRVQDVVNGVRILVPSGLVIRLGFGSVGILVAEKWVEKIISADRTSSRQICLRVLIGRKIL